jgi:hypothetical protein
MTNVSASPNYHRRKNDYAPIMQMASASASARSALNAN